MCFSTVQTLMSSKAAAQQASATNTAIRKQNIEDVKTMNYNDADLKMSQQTTSEDYRDKLTEMNMSQIRNAGTLKVAIGESGLEGNSMKRLQAVTSGDYARQAAGLKNNYERDYAAIFGKRLSNIEGTKSQISARKEVKAPSASSQILGVVMSMGQDALTIAAASKLGSEPGTKAPITKSIGTPTGHA